MKIPETRINQFSNLLGSKEFKVFAAALILFTLFAGWGGDNSWTRYDLTASIAEEGSVNIEPYSHNTIDKLTYRSNFNERNATREDAARIFNDSDTVYADKAPLTSLLGAPGYLIGDSLANDGEEDVWVDRGLASIPASLSLETSLKMFFIVLTVPVLSGSLLVAASYSYLKREIDEYTGRTAALILAVATPIFTYSTSLFGVALGAALGFGSYLALERAIRSNEQRLLILSGVLSALSVSAAYYMVVVPISLMIYLYLEKGREKLGWMVAGGILGSIPAMIYHFVITGNPFIPPAYTSELVSSGPLGTGCDLFGICNISLYSFVLDPLRTMNTSIRLLFYPTRGLFFYAPVLLLSIPGIQHVYRKKKSLLAVFPGAFILMTLLQASRINWLAGVSFGPRYMVAALPFLLLPLGYGLRSVLDRGAAWKMLVFVLFAVSVFQVSLGFGPWGDLDISAESYDEKFNSMQPIQPDFYLERVESFSTYGPRSEVLMSLTDRYKGFDITYYNPYGPDQILLMPFEFGDLTFSTSLVPLALVALIPSLLIFPGGSQERRIGVVIAVLLLLGSLGISSGYSQGEYYRGGDEIEAVNGSMELVTHSGEGVGYIKLSNLHPSEPLNISVNVDENRTFQRQIETEQEIRFIRREGRKEITLDSGNCSVPGLTEDSDDYRCLSFAVESFGMNGTEEIESHLLEGFYGDKLEEEPWMNREGRVLFRQRSEDMAVKIDLERLPYLNSSKLRFRINERNTSLVRNGTEEQPSVLISGNQSSGLNSLSVEADRCAVPAEIDSGSTDQRCLSYRIKNFTLMEPSDRPFYGEGWKERTEKDGIWMGDRSTTYQHFSRFETRMIELKVRGYEELGDNTAEVRFNGRNVANLTIDSETSTRNIMVRTRKGYNRLGIESRKGCLVPEKIEESDDDRCISVYLEGISSRPVSSGIYGEGWFSKETFGDQESRWISSKAEYIFDGSGGDLLRIDAHRYQGLEQGKLDILINGNLQKQLDGEDIEDEIVYLGSNKLSSVLSLESQRGCRKPSAVEGSDDERCLSYRIDELEIANKFYLDGWYTEERAEDFTYRWMQEESTTLFASNGERTKIDVELKPYSYLDERELEFYVNGEFQGSLRYSGEGRVSKSISVESEKGINRLELRSTGGCLRPVEEDVHSRDKRCLSFQVNRLEFSGS